MIALGLLVFMYLSLRDPRRKQLISTETFINGCFFGLFCGVLGARILHAALYPAEFANRWYEFFMPWIGGLASLGAIIGVLIGGSWYFHKHKIPVLPILDLASLYGPLLQAIARFGCFAAGCCYGAPASGLWWAVTFTNPDGYAPLFTPLHPTQLYASAASALIFVILFALQKQLFSRPGLVLCSYLALENIARFVVDFWRGDRDPLIGTIGSFDISHVQLYALAGLGIAFAGLLWLIFIANKN
jgi:phosphatidylglycerol:prolipoprotein diacylglycerol transferase